MRERPTCLQHPCGVRFRRESSQFNQELRREVAGAGDQIAHASDSQGTEVSSRERDRSLRREEPERAGWRKRRRFKDR